MLRISVITLIRTDTTLDLSQKAEKGKSLLRLLAAELRFSGPQAMTLSRQFYDPGEGAAKRRQLAGPRAFLRPPRPIFRPCIPPWGCPGGLFARARQPCPGRRREEPRAAPARAGLYRAARLAAPARLAASAWPRACFTLRSAAFTSRSLAAAPPPRASSRKDCQHGEALSTGQPYAAAATKRTPRACYSATPLRQKAKKVQPATAAARTT